MLVAKLNANINNGDLLFENYVNYAGSKTLFVLISYKLMFENYVNYAGSKTFHSFLSFH